MDADLARRPIAEHYASLPGFTSISSCTQAGVFVNLIGIVASFTEIKPTRGEDMHRSLILCDPSASLTTSGMMTQCYRPNAEDLPRPAQGSVIVLRSFKLYNYNGVIQAWSHRTSEFIIYDANGALILSKSRITLNDPIDLVEAYILRLAGWWKTRSGTSSTTNVPVPQNLNSISSHSHGRQTVCIKDIREAYFFDVHGYVVKTYPSRDDAFTLYITDYTKNPQVHDYVYGESKWAGPFGQQTIQITLWDSHARFARAHVHDGQYVLLRNVQGKRGDSGRLEGAVRGDRSNPNKVNVVIIESTHPAVKSIKLRKQQYETTWKIAKEKIDEVVIMQHLAQKALQMTPPTSINPNLETSYSQIPTTTVGDILEPPYLPMAERSEGPGARKRPHKYRTVGRIIDFWPTDLRDFSRPYCMVCQSTYSPVRSEEDETVSSTPVCTLCSAARDEENDPDTYEFSFTILLEGQDGVCIPVIFSGDDLETLIGNDIVPCDLYKPENKPMLFRLKEKLFLFWGDLEERFDGPPSRRKKRARVERDEEEEEEDAPLMWNEFCVMEYWVNPVGGKAGWAGRRFRGFGMTIL